MSNAKKELRAYQWAIIKSRGPIYFIEDIIYRKKLSKEVVKALGEYVTNNPVHNVFRMEEESDADFRKRLLSK